MQGHFSSPASSVVERSDAGSSPARDANVKRNDVRFYGYKHWTLEDVPRCFYVGKGLNKRPYSDRRSKKWHAIATRYGLRVEIVCGPMTNAEVCDWEICGKIETEHFLIRIVKI